MVGAQVWHGGMCGRDVCDGGGGMCGRGRACMPEGIAVAIWVRMTLSAK